MEILKEGKIIHAEPNNHDSMFGHPSYKVSSATSRAAAPAAAAQAPLCFFCQSVSCGAAQHSHQAQVRAADRVCCRAAPAGAATPPS